MVIPLSGPIDDVLFNVLLSATSTVINQSCLSGAGTCSQPGSVFMNSDFDSTLRLLNFRVLDANGQLVQFTAFGDSGFDYTTLGSAAPVPEPGTLLLLTSGLSATALRFRRRRAIERS